MTGIRLSTRLHNEHIYSTIMRNIVGITFKHQIINNSNIFNSSVNIKIYHLPFEYIV